MSTVIAKTEPETQGYTIDREAVLRSLGLNLKDVNAQTLLLTCERYGLDPILKHMVLIQGRPYVTRDGLLHVAHRSGQLDGIEVLEQDETTTHHVAKVAVYRKDMGRPFTYIGRYPKAGSNKAYGPEMAVKCAEVMALRRAFDVGLCAREELWDQEADEAPIQAQARSMPPVPAEPETETEKPQPRPQPRPQPSPRPVGQVLSDYRKWAEGFVGTVNAKWKARWTDENGEVAADLDNLINMHQLTNHLIKWARQHGIVKASRQEDASHRDRLLIRLFEQEFAVMEHEARQYCWKLFQEGVAARTRMLLADQAEPAVEAEDESQEVVEQEV